MSGREEGLTRRIRQVRHLAAVRDHAAAQAEAVDAASGERSALEERVAHLEQMVEGLQDSVHRETERHDRLIAELQAQIEPGAMRSALEADGRDRGL